MFSTMFKHSTDGRALLNAVPIGPEEKSYLQRRLVESTMPIRFGDSSKTYAQLDVNGYSLDSDAEANVVTDYLASRPEVSVINFRLNHVRNRVLASLISKGTALTEINALSFFTRDNDDVDLLANAVKTNTTLTSLYLPPLSNEAVTTLAKACKQSQSVQSVHLVLDTETLEQDRVCVKAICDDLIRTNSRIKTLGIHIMPHSTIDSSHIIVQIAEALKTNTTLRCLRFYDLKAVSDDSLRALVVASNQRDVPLELAMWYRPNMSQAGVQILSSSRNIVSFETTPRYDLDFSPLYLKAEENKKRHEESKSRATQNSTPASHTAPPAPRFW